MKHPVPDLERPGVTNAGPLGLHLILELYDCDPDLMHDNARLAAGMEQAVRDAGATVVETVFHEFRPGGLSGVIIITESHVTLHSWPEHGYVAIDAFTCGDAGLTTRIEKRLIAFFGAKRHSSTLINRGLPRE